MTTSPAKSIQHTPGPWTIKSTGDYQEIHPADNKFFTIAKVTGFDSHEANANARLIALSPDLYAFAAMIARMTQDGEEVDGEEFVMENDDAVATVYGLIDQARALTAEARGDA